MVTNTRKVTIKKMTAMRTLVFSTTKKATGSATIGIAGSSATIAIKSKNRLPKISIVVYSNTFMKFSAQNQRLQLLSLIIIPSPIYNRNNLDLIIASLLNPGQKSSSTRENSINSMFNNKDHKAISIPSPITLLLGSSKTREML